MKLLVKHPFLLVRGLALCQKKIHRGAIGSSKTTEIYTRVSTQEIGKIKNPLDDFYKTERSTIHANSGCIVEQNKNITEINTP
jgi:hypothetical protein